MFTLNIVWIFNELYLKNNLKVKRIIGLVLNVIKLIYRL